MVFYLSSDDRDINSHRYSRYTLEQNHTHYLFFDDGTYDSADNGGFISRIAREISRGAERRIPLVTILVGGNLYALKSIWKDLKNQVSLVIVDQSGPLANMLCRYLQKTKGESSFVKYLSVKNIFIPDISRANTNQDQDEYGDDDKITSDDENDIDDIFMLESSLAQVDAEKLSNLPQRNLKEALKPFGKWRLDIYRDLRKLYDSFRQEVYKTAGNGLSPDELLSLDEKKTLAEYLFWFVTCLNTPFRDNIHIFDSNSSIFLKNTIYNATVQG
ncbi:unnamed protein product [Adineta steineri]|uniref:TRPM SLOG domain-containing protein n=1 Tax=Adineta steineri TaxID=433720 RepID=A0A816BKJ6_9BILA|nr:unnamed protein product [Adineta steineri]CAF1608889.1 unnamed protein product [Adineta steineri]